ncbi:MAG: NADH:ubiquinone oxidoreductase [Pycnora praestabilis]|nr:MAG: NADH:ubiquinone oxidoreductase [Pycnora praestabilis]
MAFADDVPSSPPSASSSAEEALAYYKSQYEHLEQELAEFQASSRELEAELEKDVESSEKRERQLQAKVEGLGFEVEEWKSKYKQSKSEANSAQNTLQREITTLRDANRTMQLRLRDIEVANDDFERQARNTTSSLEDLESKYNVSIERGVMLEEEIRSGEQEREALRIETQRLRDELSDLKIEAEITQGKLRHSEATIDQRHYRKPSPLPVDLIPSHSPTSEHSPATTASSPTTSTPPRPKSSSTTVRETPTPPSPPLSDASATMKPSIATQHPPRSSSRLPPVDINTTPRPTHSTLRPPRHSRGPSLAPSNGRTVPSVSRRTTLNNSTAPESQDLPQSSSLHQIRGLIGRMQKLEQRVKSNHSKLPAPTSTPPDASPRSGSALGQSFVPASVTVRSSRKRTGGSIAGAALSPNGSGDTITPLTARHVSRLSFGGTTPSNERTIPIRPSSRASVSTHSSTNQHARPSSRQSLTGSRTPLGYHSSTVSTDARRPRSSISGSYATLHGHGHSASVSAIEERDLGFSSTPTPRRSIVNKNDLAQGGTAIPTPLGLSKRVSGGGAGVRIIGGAPKTPMHVRRTSSAFGFREGEGDMAPPERRKRLSGVGESY